MVRNWPRDSFPRQSFQEHCHPQGTVYRHPSMQHERYTPDVSQRQNPVMQERPSLDAIDNGRFADYDMHRRQPPMQIDEALRSHCGIAAKQYFVAAIMEDGSPMTFFSPGQRLQENAIRQFFDANKFRHVMGRIETGIDLNVDDAFGIDESPHARSVGIPNRNRIVDRRRGSAIEEWGLASRQGRKRPKARHPINDDEDVPMTVSSRRGIKISDSEAVWNFYEQRFKNCQQTACKLIAKAWVKTVEPKKQSAHPYTGNEAPDWWPKPWGPTKDDTVRHKEPDHLYKRERVHLLAHILRMVLKPRAKQHVDIQKLGLNIRKLEETTAEALSSFFMESESNAKKRPYLNEIFKVARQEERYKNGEIDGSTEIYVMAEDKVPEAYHSDTEDMSFIKDEDDYEVPVLKSSSTSGLVSSGGADPNSAPGLNGGPFIGNLPVRGSQFPAPIMTDLGVQSHAFVEGGPMSAHSQQGVNTSGSNLGLDVITSPHDTSRRPSIFSEYASPGGGSLYHQQWQSGSAGANTPSLYSYSTPQTNPQSSFSGQGVPLNPNQSFMTTSFEGSPRHDYESSSAPIFGTGDIPHASVNQQQGYDYIGNDGRVVTHPVEVVPRNAMH